MQVGGLLSPQPPANPAFRSHSFTPGLPLLEGNPRGRLVGTSSSSASGLLAGDSPRSIDFNEFSGQSFVLQSSLILSRLFLSHRRLHPTQTLFARLRFSGSKFGHNGWMTGWEGTCA